MVISKNPIKNKAAARFNHAKLNFILDIIQSKNEDAPEETSAKEPLQFPAGLLLEFIEKAIINREKIMTKYTREKIESAYILAYKNTSYEEIKPYLKCLDNVFLFNLSKHIPEIDVSSIPKEITDEKPREEETTQRLAELRKERLRNLKYKRMNKDENEYGDDKSPGGKKILVPENSSRSRRNRVLSIDPK